MSKLEIGKCDEAVVYRVAELVLGKLKDGEERLRVKEVTAAIEEEFPEGPQLTRQSVYALVAEAVRRDLVKLVPGVSRELGRQLAEKFSVLEDGAVQVVDTAAQGDGWKVAEVAAQTALRAILRISRVRPGRAVGLGLGPGRATLEFCRCLSALLRALTEKVKLKVVAITAGCPASLLENAPISFINLLPEDMVEKKIGLFAETLVRPGDFKRISEGTGVREAFAAARDIDVVVTAMGDFYDEDDLLTIFLKESSVDVEALKRSGWVGNVQYRPYTKDGPVKEKNGELRAVTVFEIEDLARLALDRNKEVILMARRCGLCKRTRGKALLPLLENPKLRVFSRLVLDRPTAEELLGKM